MRSASRPRVWFWIIAAVAAAVAVAPGLYRTAVLGSAFLAQRLCGDVFISKRDPAAVLAEDLSGPGYEPLRFFQSSVDRERRLVTASAFGVGRQISVFREGFGCTHVAPRRAIGRGSDSCSCKMACGKAGACCPKVGSPTP
jgi:hypothetical protein